MPSFVSYRGKFYPAKERIGLINKSNKSFVYEGKTIEPGDHFIYDGPDREAVKVLALAGQEFLGEDFMQDPEFLQMTRTRGFNTPEDYLKKIGYDEAVDEQKFKEKVSIVNKHELPRRNAEILAMGGGKDMSGNRTADTIGGWGSERLRSPSEIKESAVVVAERPVDMTEVSSTKTEKASRGRGRPRKV